MRTAIVYSGEARTAAQMWENHRWYLRHLGTPDVFVSVSDDAVADDMLLLKKAWPKSRWEMEKVVQADIPEPRSETKCHSGYPRSTTVQGVLRQLWSLNRAWDFLCEKADPATYDVICRCRPDIAFARCDFPNGEIRASSFHSSWVERWGGVNDRFAVMGHLAATAYFTTFQKKDILWGLGCPLHPEQMVKASLELDGIDPDDSMAAEFLTVRLPSPEHPDGGYFPISPSTIDIADYARKKLRLAT